MIERLRAQEGYSLIEMLMVMLLMGIVMGAITTVFVSGSRAEVELDRYYQAQQQARAALDNIRADVHCASQAQATTVNGYPALKLNDVNCFSATPTITWCVLASAQLTGRYALWRSTIDTSSTCTASDTTKRFEADYLMPIGSPASAGNVLTTPTIAYLGLETVGVDFKVNVTKTSSGNDTYELTDSLVTRNYTRCTNSSGCSVPTVS
jgi:prepilin-type N-terminal cleavage/methylation domain-containing protein